jgi:putative ABC transport system permease protein
MIAAFVAAFRRMARRPLRSALTILEVGLGALAVTLALNLVQGRLLAALPPDVFRVIPGERSQTSMTSYDLFKQKDLEPLQKLIPDAAVVELYGTAWDSQLEYNGYRFKILGGARVNPGYIGTTDIKMLEGTFFTKKEVSSGTPPILIASSIAKTIFGSESPIGKTLSVGLMPNSWSGDGGPTAIFAPYRVTGIFQDPEGSQTFGNDYVLLPFVPSQPENIPPSVLSIKANPGKSKTAQSQALEAVRSYYKKDFAFEKGNKALYVTTSTIPIEDKPGLDPQALLFSGLAIIMLITCSIGIFSIQLVDITERTKEIGMRRALGATRSMIVLESLASAFVLAGLGAVIGVLIAAPLLPIIKNATGPFLFSRGLEFSPIVALEVVGIVLVVGVLLGFYPALLASRLKPVEALREM